MIRKQPVNLAFVWHTYGPMHDDRCAAAARSFGYANVVGIELATVSNTYPWFRSEETRFRKVTLYPQREPRGAVRTALKLFKSVIKSRSSDVFLCNYEKGYTFLSALLLRLVGRRVYIMNDSKYDDSPRTLVRELLKLLLYAPYLGAISCGHRSQDYLRFLGFKPSRITSPYNALNVERFRRLAPLEEHAFEKRPFIIVARLVEKKNIPSAIHAFRFYRNDPSRLRRLIICGSGPLEPALRQLVEDLALTSYVDFRGFVREADVAKLVSSSLSLILLSKEEQFGNAVIEAIALRIPVIASTACGAVDDFVRSGVNGFTVEPDNSLGAAFFMKLICADEKLWNCMRAANCDFAAGFDTTAFIKAVQQLISGAIK